MPGPRSRTTARMLALALVCVVALAALAGCSANNASSGGGSGTSPSPSPEPAAPETPKPTSWVVSIVDDDSFSQGGITYSIAMNLNATNPSADPAGTYTGTATAKTDSNGTVGGATLNASAIANSTKLEFVLADMTGGGTLPAGTAAYTGPGSIVMKAAGSGSVGKSSGPFSNTSGQSFTMSVNGSKATMTIPISGHTYTFEGTISGK
jgi:hypothetical protein